MNFNLELLEDTSFSLEKLDMQILFSRFNGILQICNRIKELQEKKELDANSLSTIESIELDLWIRCGAPDDSSEGKLSAWFINTSLVGYLENFHPKNFLTNDVISVIQSSNKNDSIASLIEDLSASASVARNVIENMSHENSWAKFVAQAMALNCIVLKMLLAINFFRLIGVGGT